MEFVAIERVIGGDRVSLDHLGLDAVLPEDCTVCQRFHDICLTGEVFCFSVPDPPLKKNPRGKQPLKGLFRTRRYLGLSVGSLLFLRGDVHR